MTLQQLLINAGERIPWPDRLTQAAIARLVGRTRHRVSQASGDADQHFAAKMESYPIAIDVAAANAQHYEIPEEFFALVLGPQRKYSCCLYDDGNETLIEAEERALAATAMHADLANGQRILELGCGWGSLSLWMARRYPSAQIVSVSNSSSQRAFITNVARAYGLSNLEVVTADMNVFAPSGRFDRIVSVEMFEHMSNWRTLLQRMRDCLDPLGSMFIHIFTSASASYRFSADDKEDWIAQHYFTGGIMPSERLIRQFSDCFTVEAEWRWSGEHYRRTAADWLRNYDDNADAVTTVLQRVYGRDADLWRRRWRLFFLAVIGLFGHASGKEWGVSHYRLRPALSDAGRSRNGSSA